MVVDPGLVLSRDAVKEVIYFLLDTVRHLDQIPRAPVLQPRQITMQPTADWIIQQLKLAPHGTCGFTNETFLSELTIPAASLPAAYGGSRRLGGVLYFLLTQQVGVKLHRIRSDQMYHH